MRRQPLSRFTAAPPRPAAPPITIAPLTDETAAALLRWGAAMYTDTRRRPNGGRPGRGWTRLAREIGLSTGQVYEMASGKRRPCLHKIEQWRARKMQETL